MKTEIFDAMAKDVVEGDQIEVPGILAGKHGVEFVGVVDGTKDAGLEFEWRDLTLWPMQGATLDENRGHDIMFGLSLQSDRKVRIWREV